ncbi:MAG: hypothetical protein ACNA7W_03075 [Pseudomonadales bacterium]
MLAQSLLAQSLRTLQQPPNGAVAMTMTYERALAAGLLAVCAMGAAVADPLHGTQPPLWPREPFHFTAQTEWRDGESAIAVEFRVPLERRLVIEQISASLEVPIAQRLSDALVWTQVNEQRVAHYWSVSETGPRENLTVYSGTRQVRLYADPATVVEIQVIKNNPVCPFPCGQATLAVSGYLLHPESPSLAP